MHGTLFPFLSFGLFSKHWMGYLGAGLGPRFVRGAPNAALSIAGVHSSVKDITNVDN